MLRVRGQPDAAATAVLQELELQVSALWATF
jgi:hypothetical protein